MIRIKSIIFISVFLISNTVFADYCQDTKTECVQLGGTRYFDGVPVTLPCWQYKIERSCGAATYDNCKGLRADGCVQTGSKCRTMLGDVCVVQDETYSCPVKKCDSADGIVCGGNFFCMNGDCSSHDPITNKDFGKDASEMAAVGSAGDDVKNQNVAEPHIFTGNSMECSIDIANSKDCCKDTGWAKGVILHCSDDEKALGLAKEKELVVEAGDGSNNEYCHNKVAGICTAQHKVYCVFSNKLAKIVQQDGRKKQLGINFGHIGDDSDAVHPDCRGLTPEELQQLDFNKMDFSSLYDDIKNNTNFPDQNKAEQDIADRVKQFYDQNKKHN